VWEIGNDNKSLIQPLTSIKGLGDKAVEQILQHRPFNSVEELLFNDDIVYSKLNKKALDVMVRCGAMNCLMDERFTGMKHFWSAVAVDRPKKEKDLFDNIELYKPEGDFSDMEKIEYLTGLTGIFPFSLVLKNDVYDSIKKNKIPALGEYDKAIGVAWFIPREVIEKKTKTGKPYYIVKTIDDTNNQFAIKCWGVNPAMDRVAINRPYLAKLDYSETWGFSSRSISRNWRMIG